MAKNESEVTLSVRIPEPVKKKNEEYARADNRSFNKHLIYLLEKEMRRRERSKKSFQVTA